MQQRVYGVLDHLIWSGNGKFSLLLPEYSQLAVNVLPIFSRFQEFFGLVNTFTAKGFSQKNPCYAFK